MRMRRKRRDPGILMDENQQVELISKIRFEIICKIKIYRDIFGGIFCFFSLVFSFLWLRLVFLLLSGSLQHKNALLEPRTFQWCIALYAYSSMNFGYFSFLLLNPSERYTNVKNLFVYATVGAASYFWYVCWKTRYSNVISFLIPCVNMLVVILYVSVVCDVISLSRVVDCFGILKYDISAV